MMQADRFTSSTSTHIERRGKKISSENPVGVWLSAGPTGTVIIRIKS
jgi:hypothetical protein